MADPTLTVAAALALAEAYERLQGQRAVYQHERRLQRAEASQRPSLSIQPRSGWMDIDLPNGGYRG